MCFQRPQMFLPVVHLLLFWPPTPPDTTPRVLDRNKRRKHLRHLIYGMTIISLIISLIWMNFLGFFFSADVTRLDVGQQNKWKPMADYVMWLFCWPLNAMIGDTSGGGRNPRRSLGFLWCRAGDVFRRLTSMIDGRTIDNLSRKFISYTALCGGGWAECAEFVCGGIHWAIRGLPSAAIRCGWASQGPINRLWQGQRGAIHHVLPRRLQ